MVATLAELAQTHEFILIDLEGTASRLLSRAFARSHLVLIPLNPSPIDARLAAAAVELVHEEGEALERSIPYKLFYSCYPAAIATRSFRRIDKEIRDEQLPILSEGLVQRAAFGDLFEFANTLEELTDDKTSGLEQARLNAHVPTLSLGKSLPHSKKYAGRKEIMSLGFDKVKRSPRSLNAN